MLDEKDYRVIHSISREEIEKYAKEHELPNLIAKFRDVANEQIDEIMSLGLADDGLCECDGPEVTHFVCPNCEELIAIEDAELFQHIEQPEED
jgi:hypothetical protein